MKTIGRLNASPNKNFTRQTLKKKSTDKEILHVDSAIKKFRKLKLLRVYRAPDNFAATNLGFNVAQKLKQEDCKNKYNGLRIIRR
ncbi:MAG: hypothetical protein ACPK7O_04010 [Methanobacterium sp.]